MKGRVKRLGLRRYGGMEGCAEEDTEEYAKA